MQVQELKINSERLNGRLDELSKIGRIGDTGVCRPALSTVEKEAFELVGSWMKEAGLKVRIDHFGNLIGRMEGKNPDAPVLMMGSHLDSQPYGGRYDGPAGVLSAIEAVATLNEQGITPERPIEVVSFCDEEGWRFNRGLFGSRGILGKLEEADLERKDQDGVTREQALREFGCDPKKFQESQYKPGSIHAFLELHIEQGPVLDKGNLPLGVVSGISGPLWWTVKLKGFAGHAGSVPMAMRQDAILGMSEISLALNRIVRQDEKAPTVGTVGHVQVFPNSRNIIAEEVTFTIDLRDIDQNRRDAYEKQLRQEINDICDKYHLSYDIQEDTNSEPRYCAEWIKETMHSESKKMGLELPELMSGPFHDALMLSYACDYGMSFVRCKDGISHNPAEYSSPEDLALGAELLYRTMNKMMVI
ncbi:N-carbamoyl-L-amino-acid hydrolase [Fictibacillus enclensis]|uniref:Zn-dependent hydrolase n=1 Tax=Fictibacillus enclensis TaxID=1017270 RepID=A0A0V8JEJ8_9BACL|nr:M20 family metallo-hydrolase [Fictibacillus enclensis]KSU85486.1 Zn-dependent hydrolase [Fictibacillus enclensis]SCB97613.1 N-carbamoyl-L-amino-acid hydrolase [Fictibacillus enclensis]